MQLELVSVIITGVVGLAGVIGGICASVQSRTAVLSDTYFSAMSDAYAAFLASFEQFSYYPEDTKSRDAIVLALYRLSLYAPLLIRQEAERCFSDLLDWARSPALSRSLFPAIELQLQELVAEMQDDLDHYRRKGRHSRRSSRADYRGSTKVKSCRYIKAPSK